MGLLSGLEYEAPIRYKTLRQKCHDYEGAYAYFKTRVSEMEEKDNWAWVKENKEGNWVVKITLHSMPVYWKTEETNPPATVDIKNPQGEVIETRPKLIGYTNAKVPSKEAGIELLKALASQEDAEFKAILTDAAVALKQVDKVELPNINEYAEMQYNDSKWVDELGLWDEKDTVGKSGAKVYSKDKTNKMNQYKQLARRQLGYERARIEVELR